MAQNKPRGRFWSRLHVLVRLTGLTGLLIGGVGLAILLIDGALIGAITWMLWEAFIHLVTGQAAVTDVKTLAPFLLLGGIVAGLFTLIIELIMVLSIVAGRRSAVGFNAAVQIGLAAMLFVGLNLFSYQRHLRFDWTRDQRFTLPEEVRDQLLALDPNKETTIVVYQKHRSGQAADEDALDDAAQKVVVEKVQDLVDQFQQMPELQSRFRVVILDRKDKDFRENLDALTRGDPDEGRASAPDLRQAIIHAPESTIFFYSRDTGDDEQLPGRLQRLSFSEFYHLDRTASRQANGGKGNLVLLDQGVGPFANKLLKIDEKKPKIGILVVHEWLTTEGPEEFGLAGLKRALSQRGFDVHDVVLKKWGDAGPEPAVYTYDESKFDRLDEELTELEANIKGLQEDLAELEKVKKLWETASLAELSKRYADDLGGKPVTPALKRRQLDYFEQNIALRQLVLKQLQEDRDVAVKDKSMLSVDTTAEQRRMTDLKAKLDRAIADCDLLIIPRMTLININLGYSVPNRLQRIDDAQVSAIRDYLKAGKPILACFGPVNESRERGLADPSQSGPDGLESALSRLGIHLGGQTILFNNESRSFAERRGGILVAGANIEPPPVDFEAKLGSGGPLASEPSDKEPNPIRRSMRIVARSFGQDQERTDIDEELEAAEGKRQQAPRLDLRMRHPRPVFFDRRKARSLAFEPEFMFTDQACWNDDNPFPSRERTPRFEPPKPDDPAKGTFDEKRRGPFPIGVAVETLVPADWYEDASSAKPATVRVAAIGHGGWFVGKTLEPAQEKLLLYTCNWLMGRDDLLPNDQQIWQYPRVEYAPLTKNAMTDATKSRWHWGTFILLPALFAYVGLLVLMVRQLR